MKPNRPHAPRSRSRLEHHLFDRFTKGEIFRLAVASLFLITPPLSGQNSSEEEADEEIIELEPFTVVTSDVMGYLAGTTQSTLGINTEIRDAPTSMTVIPKELIEDLQATNFREALDYTPGVFLNESESTGGGNNYASQEQSPSSNVDLADPFSNAVSIRGYKVPNQQRLGFRIGAILPAYGVNLGGLTDTANTERQEVIRGPQALLYGIINPPIIYVTFCGHDIGCKDE